MLTFVRRLAQPTAVAVIAIALVGAAYRPNCPQGMAAVDAFCIDRWEDTVVEVDDRGLERDHSPYESVEGIVVRARTAPHVVPQGYISQVQAASACARAGKRLCSAREFRLACGGPDPGDWYPYGGRTRVAGRCNEGKGSMLPKLYAGASGAWTYEQLNDGRLNQLEGGLSRTGGYAGCESPFGVWDCVGNLHEWTAEPPDATGHARFHGGFYGDAEANGPGCLYTTNAHGPTYHDYSTGFRCCANRSEVAW